MRDVFALERQFLRANAFSPRRRKQTLFVRIAGSALYLTLLLPTLQYLIAQPTLWSAANDGMVLLVASLLGSSAWWSGRRQALNRLSELGVHFSAYLPVENSAKRIAISASIWSASVPWFAGVLALALAAMMAGKPARSVAWVTLCFAAATLLGFALASRRQHAHFPMASTPANAVVKPSLTLRQKIRVTANLAGVAAIIQWNTTIGRFNSPGKLLVTSLALLALCCALLSSAVPATHWHLITFVVIAFAAFLPMIILHRQVRGWIVLMRYQPVTLRRSVLAFVSAPLKWAGIVAILFSFWAAYELNGEIALVLALALLFFAALSAYWLLATWYPCVSDLDSGALFGSFLVLAYTIWQVAYWLTPLILAMHMTWMVRRLRHKLRVNYAI
jgi:hypothetical protein